MSPARRVRPRRGPRTSVTLLLAFAVLAGAAYFDNAVLGHDALPRAFGLRHLPGTTTGGGIAGIGNGSSDYAFLSTKANGDPVTFSRCDTIHLVVNTASAPPEAERMLREALDRVTEASGLKFVVDGPSVELPSDRRSSAGGVWSGRSQPALVAWVTPAVDEGLEGKTLGRGGPLEARSSVDASRHYVSGTVSLDGPQLSTMLFGRDGWARARAVVMHELSHMVGLDHVNSAREIMAPEASDVTEFGAGDLEGLRRLGDGPCF